MTETTEPALIPQDGILPERDAERNSPQARAMREAVEEQWRLEHPHADGLLPDFDLDKDTPLMYSGGMGEWKVVPLVQALFFAVDDYLREYPFTLMSVAPEPGRGRFVVFYDGDIIRSDFDYGWARELIRPGVEAALELIKVARLRLQREARTQAEPTGEAGDPEPGTKPAPRSVHEKPGGDGFVE